MNQNKKIKQEKNYSVGNAVKSTESVKKLTAIGLFSAFAYLCVVIFRIQVFGFLTFDIKDAVMTVGALCFGPIAGILMSFIVALIEMVTISSTMFYGFLMNFTASAVFVSVAALIYRKGRNLLSAILGLICAVFVMTTVMLFANILITPLYMAIERSIVIKMIPTVLLPFNTVKAVINAALTMILYKPVTAALSRVGMIRKPESSLRFSKSNLVISIISLVLVAACLLVCFLSFGGEFILFT